MPARITRTLFTPPHERETEQCLLLLSLGSLSLSIRVHVHMCVCVCVLLSTAHYYYRCICCSAVAAAAVLPLLLVALDLCSHLCERFIRVRAAQPSTSTERTKIRHIYCSCGRQVSPRVCVKINAQNKFKFPYKTNCANSAKIYKSNESFAVRSVL